MSLVDQLNKFSALNQWFSSPQGLHVSTAFAKELKRSKELLHGELILQLGSCGEPHLMSELHYMHKWLASPFLSPSLPSLITSLSQLSIDRNSVDCVLLPLTMEAFPHLLVLDEVDRILKPMGQLVFIGINPMSAWGMLSNFKKNACFGNLNTKLRSVFFIKRAMLQRGYIQHSLSTFYYIPPVVKEKWLYRLEICNEIGKIVWPFPAAFYCLVLQKYQENRLLETVENRLLNKRGNALEPSMN